MYNELSIILGRGFDSSDAPCLEKMREGGAHISVDTLLDAIFRTVSMDDNIREALRVLCKMVQKDDPRFDSITELASVHFEQQQQQHVQQATKLREADAEDQKPTVQ